MRDFWTGYIMQRGVLDFIFLCWRKIVSRFVGYRFSKCNSLMLCGAYQINGFRSISIEKMSAGERFRMEAISIFQDQVFSPEIVVGNNVSFGCDVHIGCISKLTIGDNVLCGSHVVIIDHDHGCYAGQTNTHSAPSEPPSYRTLSSGQIVIGDNVHIGDSVLILKNVLIGSGAVIGAGSVVTKSVPSDSLAVGNPAKVIKRYDYQTKKWIDFVATRDEIVI